MRSTNQGKFDRYEAIVRGLTLAKKWANDPNGTCGNPSATNELNNNAIERWNLTEDEEGKPLTPLGVANDIVSAMWN